MARGRWQLMTRERSIRAGAANLIPHMREPTTLDEGIKNRCAGRQRLWLVASDAPPQFEAPNGETDASIRQQSAAAAVDRFTHWRCQQPMAATHAV